MEETNKVKAESIRLCSSKDNGGHNSHYWAIETGKSLTLKELMEADKSHSFKTWEVCPKHLK